MNKNVDYRDRIIFNEKYNAKKYAGGIRRFERLDLERLEELVKNDFVDLGERQNYSPTIEEFRFFLQNYPNYYLNGYTASPDRDDYRISIDGIGADEAPATQPDTVAFVQLCRDADEFSIEPPHAWWD